MSKINDLDMTKWKELTDVWTDSLWIIPQRDNSGAHDGHYHGNFVPQIPHQLFLQILTLLQEIRVLGTRLCQRLRRPKQLLSVMELPP
jgi:hypothetical protein